MPLRDGFFSTATQTSCCNRIQRSNRVRLLVVSTHDFPDKGHVGGNNVNGADQGGPHKRVVDDAHEEAVRVIKNGIDASELLRGV